MLSDKAAVGDFEWGRWIAEYGADPPSVLRAAEAARERGSITKEELIRIAYWKSPRAAPKVATDEAVAGAHREGKICDLPASTSETGDRALIAQLTNLRGVSVSMASAVLAVVYPERFAVTDQRARQELKTLDPDFQARDTTEGYLTEYLPRVRRIAISHGITPRDVDKALWARDRERSVKALLHAGK